MLSTPSRGAIQETHLPSGDSRPDVCDGLPNIFSRGIKGTSTWARAGIAASGRAAETASSKNRVFINTSG
jgi:hypothetical protein